MFLFAFCAVFALFPFFFAYFRFQRFVRRKKNAQRTVAFFHPYCNAGGGGERVLWLAIEALQKSFENCKLVIYSENAKITNEELIAKVHDVFHVSIRNDIELVFLKSDRLLKSSSYPFLTLLLQSLGSVVVAVEALMKCNPDVYIDTVGFSFTFLVFKIIAGCKVVCYVHYPTISTDMLFSVSSHNNSFNNSRLISNSVVLTQLKTIYYRLFAYLYGIVGPLADIIFVNSTWTQNHILSLWKVPSKTFLLFPPCNVQKFETLSLTERKEETIVSISQFRPEKNHNLQLSAFNLFLKGLTPEMRSKCKLVIVGSCRNSEDENRVSQLISEMQRLNIEKEVVLKKNINLDQMLEVMKSGKIGIHTMHNEHFGISVVELMAAGLIVVANNSGGPKLDIIKDGVNGFLACEAEEYAEILRKIIEMSSDELNSIRQSAKLDINRFSDERFRLSFLQTMKSVLEDS